MSAPDASTGAGLDDGVAVNTNGPHSEPGRGLFDSDFDEDEFLKEWEVAEAHAVEVLRYALAPVLGKRPPASALSAAAGQLRVGIRAGRWPYRHMGRAAGWGRLELPEDDVDLWLGAAGGLISPREDTGLGEEEEGTIMSLDFADWLGAIIGLVRGGLGKSAWPEDLVRYIDECPEVEGSVDPADVALIEGAFEAVIPAWQAAGALDGDRRLTAMGRWGLPRALAWAWNADLDEPPSS
jgi:hypothetical protein